MSSFALAIRAIARISYEGIVLILCHQDFSVVVSIIIFHSCVLAFLGIVHSSQKHHLPVYTITSMSVPHTSELNCQFLI